MEKIKSFSVNPESAGEVGEEVEILYTVMGSLRAKIVAAEVVSHRNEENPFTEFPKGVKLYNFDDQLKTSSQMTANYGIYYPKKAEMKVRDDVVIVNTQGELLNTEELIWNRKDQRIYSDKFVKITTTEEIIYGTGFEAKEDFSDYTIKNISGIIRVNEEQTP